MLSDLSSRILITVRGDGKYSFLKMLSKYGMKTNITSIWSFFFFARQPSMFYFDTSDTNVSLDTRENQGTRNFVVSFLCSS